MKKVLIISYYWPPSSGPGVQRILKFCKYLQDYNWVPIVLTVKNGTYPSIDESLMNDIPKNVKVFSTKTSEPFALFNFFKGKSNKQNSGMVGMMGTQGKKSFFTKMALYIRSNFFIPDARKGWRKYARREAKKIIKSENIDLILTTGPPHSTHLIGLDLKKQTKVPWISDFRDPWTTVFNNKVLPRTERTRLIDKFYEDMVLQYSDGIMGVSRGLVSELSDRNRNAKVIYNGFDETDMKIDNLSTYTQKFSVAYIGNFKPNQNIEELWQVLEDICKENELFKSHLIISLTGNCDASVNKSIEKYNLNDYLVQSPPVNHQEAIQQMCESNLLLFIVPRVEDNHLIITGKLFEYIASGSKILPIGPIKGDAAHILRYCDHPEMIDYSNKDAIKKFLLDAFNDWRKHENKSKKHSQTSTLSEYTRKSQTKELAVFMNSIYEKYAN